METLSNIAKAIAETFGWARDRDVRMNTPAMQDAARAADEEHTKAKISKAVAEEDIDTIRKLASK